MNFKPELLDSMRKRVSYAIDHVHQLSDNNIPPGQDRTHIFDFDDGIRLLISRDHYFDGDFLHISTKIRINNLNLNLLELTEKGEEKIELLFGRKISFRNVAGVDDEIHFWKEKEQYLN